LIVIDMMCPFGSAPGTDALTLDAVRPEIVHRAAIVGETPTDFGKSPEKGRPSLRPGRKLRHGPMKSV